MNKKNLGRITALGIAALTAVPTFSIVASAAINVTGAYRVQTGVITTGTGSVPVYEYYVDKAKAEALTATFTNANGVETSVASTVTYVDSIPEVNYNTTIYYDGAGKIYTYNPGGGTAATWGGTSSSTSSSTSYYSGYKYASDRVYYSTLTHRYYPNATAFLSDPENRGQRLPGGTLPSQPYDSEHTWFDYKSGEYIRPTDYTGNAYYISGGKNNAYNDVDSSSTVTTTGKYTVYYSTYTGRYYDTLSAANAATPSGYTVRTITNSSYSASYLNTYGNYYGLYDYTNPYYYYYGLGYLGYYGLDSYYGLGNYGFSTSTKDTSKVTIGNLKGWTSVTRTINSAKAGASYTVNMNTETEIPESVLKALKGKNVYVNFKFSNGAIFTLNGTDITSTTAISPTVKYGSTSIPSSLKKKAVKANNGVSSSQLSINGGSFGATASVTVKFNSKRSGCSAKLYRYNSSDNTLSLVSRSAVQSNGQCEFDNVKQGGEYIVVLS